MDIPNPEDWNFTDVRFLPIFKEYACQTDQFGRNDQCHG